MRTPYSEYEHFSSEPVEPAGDCFSAYRGCGMVESAIDPDRAGPQVIAGMPGGRSPRVPGVKSGRPGARRPRRGLRRAWRGAARRGGTATSWPRGPKPLSPSSGAAHSFSNLSVRRTSDGVKKGGGGGKDRRRPPPPPPSCHHGLGRSVSERVRTPMMPRVMTRPRRLPRHQRRTFGR